MLAGVCGCAGLVVVVAAKLGLAAFTGPHAALSWEHPLLVVGGVLFGGMFLVGMGAAVGAARECRRWR